MCRWSQGTWPAPDEPKYLVLLALVERAAKIGRTTVPERFAIFPDTQLPSRFLRMEAGLREISVLAYGDQIKVDGILWRITAVREDVVWLRAARLITKKNFVYSVDPWLRPGGKTRK